MNWYYRLAFGENENDIFRAHRAYMHMQDAMWLAGTALHHSSVDLCSTKFSIPYVLLP
eukprot:SAG31_NODE_2531_length_5555_cov_4.715909_2_plen_58_part_00